MKPEPNRRLERAAGFGKIFNGDGESLLTICSITKDQIIAARSLYDVITDTAYERLLTAKTIAEFTK